MDVVTGRGGAPRLGDCRGHPERATEVPSPASARGWATAAASRAPAFSAWTPRYFAFPPSLSFPLLLCQGTGTAATAPLPLSPACAHAGFVGEPASPTALRALHNPALLQPQMDRLHFPERAGLCSNVPKPKLPRNPPRSVLAALKAPATAETFQWGVEISERCRPLPPAAKSESSPLFFTNSIHPCRS